MKNKIYCMTLLFISTLIISCSSDESLSYKNDFQSSQATWFNFKESSKNSYKYVVVGGSVFATYSWQTTITVSNGKIISRNFKYIGNTANIPAEQLEWTENESEINSHQNSGAAAALTLDEIYAKAKDEWLVKRKNVTNYFEAKNDGLISQCGYVEKGCMDDCFVGITIKSIERL
ncbi:hypothetical protein [Flavobacterium sp. CSZ]|jgi:hypothetical protein|uniref:hypothetical protein n=2 Tax=unclassified Flavobacterium TaxID=196869 RepID=UPI001E5FE079|nr:hypothetical protein [Flavobacterium sp. CSZ]